jgi:hypothetical protein
MERTLYLAWHKAKLYLKMRTCLIKAKRLQSVVVRSKNITTPERFVGLPEGTPGSVYHIAVLY